MVQSIQVIDLKSLEKTRETREVQERSELFDDNERKRIKRKEGKWETRLMHHYPPRLT